MRPRLGLLVVLGLVIMAACSQASPEERALATTEENLGDITSGRLSMTLLASSPGAAEGNGVGFKVSGPFAVGQQEGSLPVTDLEYVRVTGAERRTTRFISTGERAFAELDGEIQELEAGQVEEMRVRGDGGGAGLEGLALSTWVEDPQISGGPAVEGTATERITGAVDPVAALNDVLVLSSQFGASAEQGAPSLLEGDAAEQIRRAVQASSVDLLTGMEDRLLRHLELVIDFGLAESGAELKTALGDLQGARLSLVLDVTGINQPVQVDAPVG